MAGLLLVAPVLASPGSLISSAETQSRLGLHPAADFRVVAGSCQDCPTPPAALWYFKNDYIAVPKGHATGFDPRLGPQEEVRTWVKGVQWMPEATRPPLLWLGSPQVARGQVVAAGTALKVGGQQLPLALVPKIDANLSYYDASSAAFFAERQVKARGRLEEGKFVARSLWPEDFALRPERLKLQELAAGETLGSLVRADNGGATQPFSSRLLWHRNGGQGLSLANKPVMAFVLNGAQGDDDEAHGGHFAMATGYFGARGEWDDWLVNNFYNLDSVSEKGIIASILPMDAYQADLNSGQSWYRPTYMLAAVFKDPRTPALYQEAVGRVFNHFYRHDFRYNHATANCAGINLETLRSIGWALPRQGPGSRLKALAALPYMAIKDRSLDSGRKAYDYLSAERTNLYPFTAFEAVGNDLLSRIARGDGALTPYEQNMAADLEALIFVRIPQFPSSRAFGQAPVASIDEYMSRVPEDKSKWKIVPVPPRPFPEEFKDPLAPDEELPPSTFALAGYGGLFSFLGLTGWRLRRKRAARKA